MLQVWTRTGADADRTAPAGSTGPARATARRVLRAAAIGTAAAAAAAAALTGCSTVGGASTPSSDTAQRGGVLSSDTLAQNPLTAVRGAADITGHSGTLHDTTTLVTVSASQRVTLHGSGDYDYTKRVGRLVVNVPAGSGGAKAPGKLTEVVAPGVVYMLNRSNDVPAGKWVKLDVRELSDGNLVSSGATDPASAAAALRGADSAHKAGSSEIGGVRAVEYTGTLDLAAAAKATGGPAANGLMAGANAFTVKQVPYQVWLDPHGRILRVIETFTFAKVPGSTKAADQVRVTSESDFGDFGAPVTVSVPPDSELYSGTPSPSAAP